MISENSIAEISAGIGVDPTQLDTIVETIKAKGAITPLEVQQLTSMGVPIYGAIASAKGINRKEAGEAIKAGKVTFDDFESAIESLTSEGGLFYKLSATSPDPDPPTTTEANLPKGKKEPEDFTDENRKK